MAGSLPLKNDVQLVTQSPQSRRQALDVLSAAESVLPISDSEVTCGPMTRPATLNSSATSSSNSTDFSSSSSSLGRKKKEKSAPMRRDVVRSFQEGQTVDDQSLRGRHYDPQRDEAASARQQQRLVARATNCPSTRTHPVVTSPGPIYPFQADDSACLV